MMNEADADPLDGNRCPLHLEQHHCPIKIKQQTEDFEDIRAFDAP